MVMKKRLRSKGNDVIVVLHNIRSTHNVGSIFRTADCVGVSHIYLTGYTPAPVDRFGRKCERMGKTALGAEELVLWDRMADIGACITLLRTNEFFVVGVEQDAEAIEYRTLGKHEKIAFIFGNEVTGIPRAVLKQCNVIAEIPLRGNKESLNVSVCAGIVLFHNLE
jgi:23S rRNA (guanosine2251-2'-O)-methyltransferase